MPQSQTAPKTVDALMALGPVIPVITIERVADAAPLAKALIKGGVRVFEVTLRTPAAIDAIVEMCAIEGAVVGVGTLLSPRDVERATKAGARFLVSPGLTDTLFAAAKETGLPFLPGVLTAGEIMRGLDLGATRFKFFPAENFGGAGVVKAFAGPFPGVKFCPTGGITVSAAPGYLALGNVGCVGGTWLTPKTAIEQGDWEQITRLAREAAALRP